MRLVDHPELIARLPAPTLAAPWRILVSGCILGWACGVDGSDNGMGGALAELLRLERVVHIGSCPEDIGLGTPRATPDIHGGDGFAVLDGAARVLDEHGVDLSAGTLAGARAMLERARVERVHLAILTDASGACGTQVIYDGCRFDEPPRRQRGMGVAAAMLSRAGVPVMSQRDDKTLDLLRARLEPGYQPDPAAIDHHEHPWVREHLPE
jgi:uncharacterized protein YbbK (DUF523 family)